VDELVDSIDRSIIPIPTACNNSIGFFLTLLLLLLLLGEGPHASFFLPDRSPLLHRLRLLLACRPALSSGLWWVAFGCGGVYG
jgi:hypothetical protein